MRPRSIFVSAFQASQKWIRRNLNSSSCGPNLTSLKNTTSSVLAEGTPVPPLRLTGTSEHTTALLVDFFDIGSPETVLAEETLVWPVRLIGPAEETPSFLFGFFDMRSPKARNLLLESIYLISSAEETPSLPFGFFEIRLPETGDLLLESIA